MRKWLYAPVVLGGILLLGAAPAQAGPPRPGDPAVQQTGDRDDQPPAADVVTPLRPDDAAMLPALPVFSQALGGLPLTSLPLGGLGSLRDQGGSRLDQSGSRRDRSRGLSRDNEQARRLDQNERTRGPGRADERRSTDPRTLPAPGKARGQAPSVTSMPAGGVPVAPRGQATAPAGAAPAGAASAGAAPAASATPRAFKGGGRPVAGEDDDFR